MKQLFKNYWKPGLIILIVILGFLFCYEVLPVYNQAAMQVGYNQCVNDYANSKSIPLAVTNGNQTMITPVEVCSEFFLTEFNAGRICGVSG